MDDYKVFKRGYTGVLNKLKEFAGKNVLYTTEITESYLNKFYDFLETTLTGETPASYFKKLKRLLKEATKQKLFTHDPASDFRCRKFESKEKEILTFDEIRVLISASCPNQEVKKAFIFSCLTGLRWCDVKELQGNAINGNRLELIQKKTKVKVSGILNSDALKLINTSCKDTQLMFQLPSHTACLKSLRKWLANAEINKHIGWHNSRHSFCSNLILNGTDIYTASKMMGHTSLKHTERYVRESVKLKENAFNNLPKLY